MSGTSAAVTSNLTAVGRALAHVVGQLPLTGSELIGLQLAVALLFSGAMFQ
ncbi:MAG TPA: hypothetical protein VGJ86_02290 [Acidimicrobiales bacterium]